MKLDRNINGNGRGKYALLKLRKLDDWLQSGATAEVPAPIREAIALLEREGMLDWGDKPETEFFLIRLKDKYARRRTPYLCFACRRRRRRRVRPGCHGIGQARRRVQPTLQEARLITDELAGHRHADDRLQKPRRGQHQIHPPHGDRVG